MLQANPRIRGPILFLVDSICKNIGEPYVSSFVKHGLVSALVRIFGDVSGDEGLRRDLLRVLPTWRGVFHPSVLEEIDGKIRPYLAPGEVAFPPGGAFPPGTGFPPRVSAHVAPLPAPFKTPVFRPDTLRLLQDLLALFSNPPGPRISGIVGEIFNRVLGSMRRRVLIMLHYTVSMMCLFVASFSLQLSRTEMPRELLHELDQKARLSDKRPVIHLLQSLVTPSTPSAMEPAKGLSHAEPNPPATAPPSLPLPFNLNLPLNFQFDPSLLSSIAEVTRSTDGSIHGSPIKPRDPPTSHGTHAPRVELSSANLQTTHFALHRVLYDDLPLQCKVCAIRYCDTEDGRAQLATHLDAHFRRNMRLKEKSKKVLARDWLGDERAWIEGRGAGDGAERHVALFVSAQASEDATADLFVSEDDALRKRASANRVPADEEQTETCCHVCQEAMNAQWDDDTEQWVFLAAIRNDAGHIIHDHCIPTDGTATPAAKRSKQ